MEKDNFKSFNLSPIVINARTQNNYGGIRRLEDWPEKYEIFS